MASKTETEEVVKKTDEIFKKISLVTDDCIKEGHIKETIMACLTAAGILAGLSKPPITLYLDLFIDILNQTKEESNKL